MFVSLRLLDIIDTEFISTTQKKNFKRTVHLRSVNTRDNVKSLQLNLGLSAAMEVQTGWSLRDRHNGRYNYHGVLRYFEDLLSLCSKREISLRVTHLKSLKSLMSLWYLESKSPFPWQAYYKCENNPNRQVACRLSKEKNKQTKKP